MSTKKQRLKSLLSSANNGDLQSFKIEILSCISRSNLANETFEIHEITHPKSGDSLLHIFARLGHLDCLEYILDSFPIHVDQRNFEGKTALQEASQFGQSILLPVLLQHGADINALKRSDWTALMLAATKSDNLDCIKTLVTNGSDLKLVNKDGWNCFHIAVRSGNLDVLEYLLSMDDSLWQTVSKNGRTVLHTACLSGKTDVVRFLLKLPLDVNAQDSCGSSSLMEAARGNHLECFIALLDSNSRVDLHLLDRMGRGVSQISAQAGSLQILEYLRNHCGIENQENGILHAAAREGQEKVVEKLLVWGFEVDQRDKEGRTPLFLSISGQHAETSLMLLKAGASLYINDNNGIEIKELARKPAVVDIVNKFL